MVLPATLFIKPGKRRSRMAACRAILRALALNNSIHRGRPLLTAGAPLETARAAVILIHGRGASAESILTLAPELATPDVAFLAPQAANNSWYPFHFMTPIDHNEPFLSSALAVLDDLLAHLAGLGLPPERVVLGGFSQGACLTSEYIARNARRYGGLLGLSGGLIGPEGTSRSYTGDLAGTPIFLGCSDVDSFIPKERVLESEAVLRGLGGQVTAKLYPGMGHTVNADELEHARAIVAGAVGARN
jgi:phospholipase/carboxylesterase